MPFSVFFGLGLEAKLQGHFAKMCKDVQKQIYNFQWYVTPIIPSTKFYVRLLAYNSSLLLEMKQGID